MIARAPDAVVVAHLARDLVHLGRERLVRPLAEAHHEALPHLQLEALPAHLAHPGGVHEHGVVVAVRGHALLDGDGREDDEAEQQHDGALDLFKNLLY